MSAGIEGLLTTCAAGGSEGMIVTQRGRGGGDDHHTHVTAIRDGIDAVADEQGQVETAMGAIVSFAREVDTAVLHPQAATRSIARAVDEAVAAGMGISHDLAAIGGTAQGTAASATEVDALALRLTDDAGRLESEVERLLPALVDA